MNAGKGWQIEFYEDDRGRSPLEAFIDSLEEKMSDKVERALDILRDGGP
jgi:hypothetical protein